MAHHARSHPRLHPVAALLLIATTALLSTSTPAHAADAPLSYDASPEIYKVLSENDDFRVIKATWAPGARDKFHSHPVSFVSYFLTDCTRRFYFPDGTTSNAVFKQGQVTLSGHIESHSFENAGTTPCEILIVDKTR